MQLYKSWSGSLDLGLVLWIQVKFCESGCVGLVVAPIGLHQFCLGPVGLVRLYQQCNLAF